MAMLMSSSACQAWQVGNGASLQATPRPSSPGRPAVQAFARKRHFCTQTREVLVRNRAKGVRVQRNSIVRAMAEDPAKSPNSGEDKSKQAWLNPDSGELPPWARNEKPASASPPSDLPFPLYLIASVLVTIAAVGSVFEYVNQNPVFGVVYPDSPLWAPILGFFAITGLPTAGFLLYKAISGANKAAQRADEEDGFY